MSNTGAFRRHARKCLDESIHAVFRVIQNDWATKAAYERLLRQVRQRTGLLRATSGPGDRRVSFNLLLLTLAHHHADWLRPIETWAPASPSPWLLFMSLGHHLFTQYPVPAFMTSVWFDFLPDELPDEPDWYRHLRLPEHEWYKHLGRGRNIRTADLPLRFTKAMAHQFHQAPDHFGVYDALRWAQVRGLGGSESLAQAVLRTRLGYSFEHEDFWETVLRFCVNHPRLDLAKVRSIVYFLHQQKFATREGVTPEGVFGTLPPPQPEYSLKGRTVASLLRQAEEWERQVEEEKQRDFSWNPSPIGAFRLVEGNAAQRDMRCWTVTELLSSRALSREGREMKHCVAGYARSCGRKWSSIWSLGLENRRGRHRVLTIEVDPDARTIVQVRGKQNRVAQFGERAILQRWAEQEGLQIEPGAWSPLGG
jgi:hypothetical protein